MKKLDYLYIGKSEISGHCLQTMEIVHHHANGSFDWLISEHQIGNLCREATSILPRNTKDLRLSIRCSGNTYNKSPLLTLFGMVVPKMFLTTVLKRLRGGS